MKRIVLITLMHVTAFQTYCMEGDATQSVSAEYLAIQKIYEITEKVATQARKDYNLTVSPKEKHKPNKCELKTTQGMYLTIGAYAKALGTPYGKVGLFDLGSCSHHKNIKLTQEFMKHFTLSFIHNVAEYPSTARFLIPHNATATFYKHDTNNYRQEITREELDSFRGSEQLITCPYAGCVSVYEIKAIEGVPLPKLITK